VIARAGHPVVRLVPIADRALDAPRVLGALKGKGRISGDFDAPLDEDFLFTSGGDDRRER